MADEKMNTTAKKLYRPGEIASEIGIPASTLRTWAERFASHFDGGVRDRPLTAKGKPTMRMYSRRDVQTLRQIQAMLAGGLSYEQIEDRLGVVELPAVIPEPQSKALEVLPKLAEALTVIANQRNRLDDLEARLEALERRRAWWAFWRR